MNNLKLDERLITKNSYYTKWIQSSLNNIMRLHLNVNGSLNPETRSAIRNFQFRNGIISNGIVDPRTEAAMVREGAGLPPQGISGGAFGNPSLYYNQGHIGSFQKEPIKVAPYINWSKTSVTERILFLMNALIKRYELSINGASGLVGNLLEESGLLPNRIEGSHITTPMTAFNFKGVQTTFSAVEIMNRNPNSNTGPKLPGVGLAQWTTPVRRSGLFQHSFNGKVLGANILFNMTAQIDYLIKELMLKYRSVYELLKSQKITVNDASDEVVYRFEVPGSILSKAIPRRILPRNVPQVQEVFQRRRKKSQFALKVYSNAI